MCAFRTAMLAALFVLQAAADAQLANLRITEVMFNPSASEEAKFEWVEVQNFGGTAIDLDGYVFSDLGGILPDTALDPVNILSAASGGSATNTVVPAGGLAVLYNGTAFEFDDSRFRAGWQLAPGVPLIAVDTRHFPTLNNSGDVRQLGLWSSAAQWRMDAPAIDITDPPDGVVDRRVVAGFGSAQYSFDYTITSGFPSGNASADQGKSIAWTGVGTATDPSTWVLSEVGVHGASSSVATFLPGGDRRNGLDVASPGVVPSGNPASGLLITEVMVDPAAGDDGNSNLANAELEWIEIYNNTGVDIDFTLGGYVLDDFDGSVKTAANIADGFLANGQIAVLFDGDALSIPDMVAMWGAGNYLPVSGFPALANGGETFGLWSSLADYQLDAVSETFGLATASLTYEDSTSGWPDTGDPGSIYLADLGATDGNGLMASGVAWAKSTDGVDGARVASQLGTTMTPDYVAGDTGSPGRVGASTTTGLAGDFNDDRVVDLADYVVWRDHLGSTSDGVLSGNGDESGSSSGIVDANDYLLWKANFGTLTIAGVATAPVCEPASIALIGLGAVAGFRCRGRKRYPHRAEISS